MMFSSLKKALLITAATAFLASPSLAKQDGLFDPIIGHSAKERAQIMRPVGSPFHQALHLEYLKLAKKRTSSDKTVDTFDQSFLSHKAIAAAQGIEVAPESPGNWTIHPLYSANVIETHARLAVALNSGAANLSPLAAAKAQANFDCWIEDMASADEEFQPVSECLGQFNAAMDSVEKGGLRALQPAGGSGSNATYANSNGDLAYQPNTHQGGTFVPRFIVFFGYGRSGLDSQGKDVIQIAANKILDSNPKQIELFGFTDSSGSKAANKRLAEKRISAVKRALISRGVSPTLIKTQALGEDNPLVKTRDGKREAGNRRVEILLR